MMRAAASSVHVRTTTVSRASRGAGTGSAGEPVQGGADLDGVHRVGGQGAVQDQALDQRVDLARGDRVQVVLEAAAAAVSDPKW